MDIATDIFRLADKVSHVPGLSIAWGLAMQIMKTVQISKKNTARLQYLAHLIADFLVSIVEHMEGKWDQAPSGLKIKLDEFEATLEVILKAVIKYTHSSRVTAFINAGTREVEITMLERRLSDAQKSILLLLGIETSLTLRGIERTVNALQEATVHTMYSRLEGIAHQQSTQSEFSAEDDPNLRIYTLDDIQVLRAIKQGYSDEHVVTVTLHEAERCDDGRAILVKSYHGTRSAWKRHFFERDLALRKNFLDPSILQLVGTSKATASIPFQVYHAPHGHFETLDSWLTRTLTSNPLEGIYGLYDMRTSVAGLGDFQVSRPVGILAWPSVCNDLIVNVRPGPSRDQHKSALIYAGEIFDQPEPHRYPIYYFMETICHRNQSIANTIAHAFCNGLFHEEFDGPSSALDNLLPCLRLKNASTLSSLGATLFEHRSFVSRSAVITPTRNVALGDIGYVTEDDMFVVVDNIHTCLQSTFGTLTWELELKPSGIETQVEDTVSNEGKSYRRTRHVPHTFLRDDGQRITAIYLQLDYKNLDERHAWKMLQRHACAIISRTGLSLAPYDLRLVVDVNRYVTPSLESLDNRDDTDSLGQSCSTTDSDDHREVLDDSPPPLYTFFDSDAVHVRESGAPELRGRLRSSFEAEPEWLDDTVWDTCENYEEKGGFCLFYDTGMNHMIGYLQLPIDLDLPFITEVED